MLKDMVSKMALEVAVEAIADQKVSSALAAQQ